MRLVHKRREERGFTLVEVMIVIAIIGLISSIVAINVMRSGSKAKQEKVRLDAERFEQAIIMYWRDTSQQPQDIADLIQDPGVEGWDGPYITGGAKALRDPWGNDYVFEYTGTGDPPYRIGSYGADNSPGGEGENKDIFPADEQL